MTSRSAVRTNAIIFSILGLVVALLIHFLVLSSPRYNWIDPVLPQTEAAPEALFQGAMMVLATLGLM